jgi:hypothetical protein
MIMNVHPGVDLEGKMMCIAVDLFFNGFSQRKRLRKRHGRR